MKKAKNKRILKKAGILIFACLLFVGCLPSDTPPTIKKTEQGGYVLFVKGRPFLIKGVTYNPAPIGQGYDYDLFSDPDKPWLVDGKLMKKMGVNCIRVYSSGQDIEKLRSFVRQMYNKFGIYTIIGTWLGLWDYPGPNYANPEFREKVKTRFIEVVKALKDEPGVLIWVLGNENNYTCTGNISFWTSPEIEKIGDPAEKIRERARFYYSFVEELTQAIKEVDQRHLVALGNGEATLLDVASQECPSIDLLGLIVYRGKRFGHFFENVRREFDKPIFLSEFGADSYNAYTEQEDQNMQKTFLVSEWKDLYTNTVFSGNESGNCLGGVIFSWTDEWWKHNEGYPPAWDVHDTEAGWSNGSYYYDIKAPNNLNMNEEWFGLVAISKELNQAGINKREPKEAYYALRKLWRKKITLPRNLR
jgi:hypothetical protein